MVLNIRWPLILLTPRFVTDTLYRTVTLGLKDMPAAKEPNVDIESREVTLGSYATSGYLATDDRQLLGDLFDAWRVIRRSQPVVVMNLDFKGIAEIRHDTGNDVIASFIRMVLGTTRPCYIVFRDLPDAKVKEALDSSLAQAEVVVAANIAGEELTLVGDKRKVDNYLHDWRTVQQSADRWIQNQEIIQLLRGNRTLPLEMYDEGILIRWPITESRSPYYHRLPAGG